MLQEQAGNCGVAISGWNSNRLKHSHCAESKTANYEEVTLATASSHLSNMWPSRALEWMYGFLCKVSTLWGFFTTLGQGWGLNSPSTHSVATSRETEVRVLVLASVYEYLTELCVFSTPGSNPSAPFFPPLPTSKCKIPPLAWTITVFSQLPPHFSVCFSHLCTSNDLTTILRHPWCDLLVSEFLFNCII